MIINSVLALYHVLTLANALLIVISRSLVVEAAKLILVSSVYIRAVPSSESEGHTFVVSG